MPSELQSVYNVKWPSLVGSFRTGSCSSAVLRASQADYCGAPQQKGTSFLVSSVKGLAMRPKSWTRRLYQLKAPN